MTTLKTFVPREWPGKSILLGDHVRLEPIDWEHHGQQLAKHIIGEKNNDLWTYMPIGPFDNLDDLQSVIEHVSKQLNWQTMVIIRKHDGAVVGMASFMRNRPEHGSTEIGCVVYSGTLKRSIEATETMYLLAAHVFDDLKYRRYEWKCDNGNEASKRAALRLGFQFEGIFRNDLVIKQRNRDTAWFSMTNQDWPKIKNGFKTWLTTENFDKNGNQNITLVNCRET